MLGYSVLPACELLSVMSGFVIIEVHCTDQAHFRLIIPLFCFEPLSHQEKLGMSSGGSLTFKFFKM